MIVVSLLLIFVAVVLLAVGLAGGSGVLLISSIVASLLAAIALVIGARRTAAVRRATAGRAEAAAAPGTPLDAQVPVMAGASGSATGPVPPGPGHARSGERSGDAGSGHAGPGHADSDNADAGYAGPDYAGPDYAGPDYAGPDYAGPVPPGHGHTTGSGPSGPDPSGAEPAGSVPTGRSARGFPPATPTSFSDDDPAAPAEGPAGAGAHIRAASRDDAESALAADAAYRAATADHDDARPGADRYDSASPGDYDYDAASPGAYDDAVLYDDARAESRSRGSGAPLDPAAEGGPDLLDDPYADQREPAPDYDRASSFIGAARSENPNENAWRREPTAGAQPDQQSRPGGPQRAYSSASGDPEYADVRAGTPADLADPDDDDPDDEPPPQAVLPADAVRVARLAAEVVVVDGRPRYHLTDCPHLVGRATEPLEVNEAVELGFSPCGLCRPVDRLVARSAHR
jgi:clumping factor A